MAELPKDKPEVDSALFLYSLAKALMRFKVKLFLIVSRIKRISRRNASIGTFNMFIRCHYCGNNYEYQEGI